MSELREGIHGGLDLLERDERVTNSEDAEKNESLNIRSDDLLDQALSTFLGKPVGGYITNRLYEKPMEFSQNEEFEYDRYYFEHRLLVDLMQEPMNDEDKKSTQEDIERKTAYAKEIGMRYLPIVGMATTHGAISKAFDS